MTAMTKARKAAREIANGSTIDAAMRVAGYSDSTIESRSASTMTAIRNQFFAALRKAIPDEAIIAGLVEGMQATHAVVVMDGQGTSHVEMVPDYHARVKILQLVAQMAGLLVRYSEVKQTTEVSVADALLAAQQRLRQSVTVDAQLLPRRDQEREPPNRIRQLPEHTLGHEPNEETKSE